MAVPGGTNTAYNQVTNREDLMDFVTDISPMETPAYMAFGAGVARNVYHEYPTDKLDAPDKTGKIEGDDAAGDAANNRPRVGNYCQITEKTAITSLTQEAVDPAGVNSEHAYQIAKRTRELKRNIEAVITQQQASSAGTEGSAARTAAGSEAWLSTNVDHGATGSTPGYSGGIVSAVSDGTARALSESGLYALHGQAWAAGGDPTMYMVGTLTKRVMSQVAGIATQYRDNAPGQVQATIISGADAVVGDYGNADIVPNRFMRDGNVQGLDTEYWEVSFLRPVTAYELGQTGSSRKTMIEGEFTLRARAEDSSFKYADIDTALAPVA